MSSALSRYEIKEPLAEGGLGTVFKAYDTKLSRDVAVKRLHAQEGIDPEEMHKELLRESRVLSQVQSANIVTVFDVERDDDEGSFVVMELLVGETLEDVVSRAPMVEADFISVAQQSLEGVIAAHSGGLIHSDLKPENFMITWWPSGRFQLKLLDFGIASFVNAASTEAPEDSGDLLGSIFFMAPEQFKKKPVDQRTDIYSLGCVYYYTLTGKYPFDGDTSPQVMASHLQNRYTPLSELRPDLDPRIIDVIHSMISKLPEDRFQTALDVLKNFDYIRKTDRPVIAQEVVAPSGVRLNLDTPPAPAIAPEDMEFNEGEEQFDEDDMPLTWILSAILAVVFGVIGLVAYFMLS